MTTQGALCVIGANAACLAAADAATRCPGWRQWAFVGVILACFVAIGTVSEPADHLVPAKAATAGDGCTKPVEGGPAVASVPKLEQLTTDYVVARLDQLRAERASNELRRIISDTSARPSVDEAGLRRQGVVGDSGKKRLRLLAE